MTEPCVYCGDSTAQGSALHLDRRVLEGGRFVCAECHARFGSARKGSEDARRRAGVEGMPPEFLSLGLGEPVIVLRPLTHWKWVSLIGFLVAMVFSALLGVGPGWLVGALLANIVMPGVRGGAEDAVVFGGAAVGAGLAGGLMVLYWRRLNRDHAQAIGLFSGGLAVKRRSSDQALPWSEISATRQKHVRTSGSIGIGPVEVPVEGRSTSSYTIVHQTGQRVVFDSNFDDADWLFGRIEASVQPAILKGAALALDADGAVSFGPIALRSSGIEMSGRNIPWSELKHVSVENGQLRLRAARWVGLLDIGDIDNASSLLTLVRAYGVPMT